MTDYTISHDAVYPRDDEHRYRLYGRQGNDLRVLACASTPEAIGGAIAQLHADQKEHGETLGHLGATGIYDAVNRDWLVLPWQRRSLAYPDRHA